MAGVAACGGPSGQAPAAYIHSICSAYASYEAAIGTQGTTFSAAETASKGNAPKIKAAALAFLDGQVTASAALEKAVAAQGRPSGNGGDAVRAGFVSAATQAHTIFVSQAAAVRAADPTDTVSFYAVLNEAVTELTTAGQALQTGLENVGAVGDQTINNAIAADQTCSGLAAQ
jgi:hypothetical protein